LWCCIQQEGCSHLTEGRSRIAIGDVDPAQEPYRSEFERDKILVFNLTGLASPGDNAHDRAFDDVTSVMGMLKRRLSDGQAMTEPGSGLGAQIE
jgi:hypothetical protein